MISGAGAKHTRVKRLGLDWLWTNRLARLVGLRDALPAVGHRLVFAAGHGDDRDRAGYGYAVLVASPDALRVEFWDFAVPTPFGVAELGRPSGTHVTPARSRRRRACGLVTWPGLPTARQSSHSVHSSRFFSTTSSAAAAADLEDVDGTDLGELAWLPRSHARAAGSTSTAMNSAMRLTSRVSA